MLLGSTLLEALMLRAAEHFSEIVLNVHIRNPAARLYSRVGFTVPGKGHGLLGVAMRRDLSASEPRPLREVRIDARIRSLRWNARRLGRCERPALSFP
jgi:hypothetical protein